MTTRILICMLAVALAMLLTPARQHADATRAREAIPEAAQPTMLHVGAERKLKRPSTAAKIARDGDIIEIDTGAYDGDAAV